MESETGGRLLGGQVESVKDEEMRIVRWVHISDLHMREAENAQRQAVLSAMLDDLRGRVADDGRFDFVVVTGDLAFSGQGSEYRLVEDFLDELGESIAIARRMIFRVPGNHDVDRGRSKMCFTERERR